MNKVSDGVMAYLLANSYCNYHAKGVDYLCLRRSSALTLKVYFFDNPAFGTSDVVCPHDHRYDFNTAVIRGHVTNVVWREANAGAKDMDNCQHFDRFRFYTPLLGGRGFEHDGAAALVVDGALKYGTGQQWQSLHRTVHTLQNVIPGTILALEQYADLVPVDAPTLTFVPVRAGQLPKPPSLTGLYDRFTADAVLARLNQLEIASPGALAWLKEGA